MGSKNRASLILLTVVVVLSAPLCLFGEISYAKNNKWNELSDNICGKSMDGYNADYKDYCVMGIGQTDNYCETNYASGTTEQRACEHGVYWSNINSNQPDPGQWIQDNCTFVRATDKSQDVYECEGETPWTNNQGVCSVFNTWRPGTGRDQEGEVVTTATCSATEEEATKTYSPGTSSEDSLSETCEDKSSFGWIACSAANTVSGLIDVIIEYLLIPMLQWRILV